MKIYGTENNTFILEELGKRIRDTRINMSMTRESLCEHAGVSFSTLTRIENGESVNMDNFMRVLYSLGCLENMDLLVPEQEIRPSEIISGKKKRVRASKRKINTEWKWGDEE